MSHFRIASPGGGLEKSTAGSFPSKSSSAIHKNSKERLQTSFCPHKTKKLLPKTTTTNNNNNNKQQTNNHHASPLSNQATRFHLHRFLERRRRRPFFGPRKE
jgi:hypothetical protein